MPDVGLSSVISCSSEDAKWPAKNLLESGCNKPWKCVPGEKQTSIIFQLDKQCVLHSLDIGNCGSSMIEVLVGRSSVPDKFEVLLAASSFMSPTESRTGLNGNKVRMFAGSELMDPVVKMAWDRVKVVCTQQFNQTVGFGLSFINLKTRDGEKGGSDVDQQVSKPTKQLSLGKFVLKPSSDDEDELPIKPGAMFRNRKSLDSSDGGDNLGTISFGGANAKPSVNSNSNVKQSITAKHASSVKHAAAKLATGLARDIPTEENEAKRKEKQASPMTAVMSPTAVSSKIIVGKERIRPSATTDKKDCNNQQSLISNSRPSSNINSRQIKNSEVSIEKIPKIPLGDVMDGVTFVLSGYQNPNRGRLREQAQEMGARYKPDWGPGCTHLICAFAGTPKYNQVFGKGKIVNDQWIADCHKQSKSLPWRNYSLEKTSQLYLNPDEPSARRPESKKSTVCVDGSKHVSNGSKHSTNGTTDGGDCSRNRIIVAKSKDNVGSEIKSKQPLPNGLQSKHRTDKTALNEADMYDLSTDEEGAAELADSGDETGDTDDEIERIKQRSTRTKKAENGAAGALEISDNHNDSGKKEICVIPKYKQRPSLVAPPSDDDNSRSPIPFPDVSGSRKRKSPASSPSKRPKYEIGPDGLPVLPEFLEGCVIFLYGDFTNSERRELKRFVIAFGGEFVEYMNEKVNHVVVADEQWDDIFDETLKDFPDMKFVGPKWILTMGKEGQNVDINQYLISKC